jgi:hypothetical protein
LPLLLMSQQLLLLPLCLVLLQLLQLLLLLQLLALDHLVAQLLLLLLYQLLLLFRVAAAATTAASTAAKTAGQCTEQDAYEGKEDPDAGERGPNKLELKGLKALISKNNTVILPQKKIKRSSCNNSHIHKYRII